MLRFWEKKCDVPREHGCEVCLLSLWETHKCDICGASVKFKGENNVRYDFCASGEQQC